MTAVEILHHRLRNQRLVGSAACEPAEVVTALGAVQAQEYAMARWAVGLRTPDATLAEVDAALAAGAILRTHVLRPTWHFVAPVDLRWLLALTAPRVLAAMAGASRRLDLDTRTFRRGDAVIARVLADHQPHSRPELEQALQRARISTATPRLSHLLMHAELRGLICSGPRRGRQATYVLLDDAVPPSPPLPRAEAIARLAARYFRSRGPATVHDFAWWSGLTVTDARAGAEMLGADFARVRGGGHDYFLPETAAAAPRTPADFLLPDYDEYAIAYRDRQALFHSAAQAETHRRASRTFNRLLILGGRVAGSWRSSETLSGSQVEIVPSRPLDRRARAAVLAAVRRFGRFAGKDFSVVLAPPDRLAADVPAGR